MEFPHGVTVTVRSVTTTTDPLGNTSEVTSDVAWGPCAVAPRYATESVDPRVPPVIVGKVVYGPTAAINSDDLLIFEGVTWQVDGEPGAWLNPFTGWDAGIEVPVKRVASV